MEQVAISATKRTEKGKNACRRMRASGQIPGILYGLKQDPVPLSVDPKRIGRVLRSASGANTLCALTVEGDEASLLVMIKDFQLDPITHTVLHADFIRISMESKLSIRVPIHLTGEPVGVKMNGGILEFIHREVEIECLPTQIPDRVEVEISALDIGDFLKYGQILLDPALTLLSEPDDVFVHVAAPRAEAVEAPAEAAAEAEEPEVIGKKKKEEEEEAGKAGGEESKKPEKP